MMNRLLPALPCLLFFWMAACTKTDSTNNGATGGLRPFSVTVVERTGLSALIQWDSSMNTINAEVPKYKVFLRDRVYHDNLSRLEDSLYLLDRDSVYNGKVVAYISTGDSVFAPFTISAYQGTLYASTISSWGSTTGRLACFNAYPILTAAYQPTLWQVNTPAASVAALSNDTLFTVMNRRMTATNARTGATLWQTAAGITISTDPTYYNGRLYVGTNLGLAAFNATNGQVVWTFNQTVSGMYLNSTPVVEGDKVFVALTNFSQGEMHAVDAATGRKLWTTTFTNTGCDRPLAVNGVVVLVSNVNGTVTAYNSSTGSILWTKTGLGSNGVKEVNPVFSEGNVLIHIAGPLYAFNLQTGAIAWQINTQTVQEMIAGNGKVYFTMAPSVNIPVTLVCVNGKTGQPVWTSPLAGILSYSNLVLAKDRVYCLLGSDVNSSNTVRTFNALTGKGDLFFDTYNPAELAYRERITSFIVKRDGVVYYPDYHGNYK